MSLWAYEWIEELSRTVAHWARGAASSFAVEFDLAPGILVDLAVAEFSCQRPKLRSQRALRINNKRPGDYGIAGPLLLRSGLY